MHTREEEIEIIKELSNILQVIPNLDIQALVNDPDTLKMHVETAKRRIKDRKAQAATSITSTKNNNDDALDLVNYVVTGISDCFSDNSSDSSSSSSDD